ncbi:hypothetical protein CR513_59184, partial [Mucuna pruriens]
MCPKYTSLWLLVILGMVLLATTSLADRRLLSVEESSVTDDHHYHHHYPPKKHWPPTTQNEPSKVENKEHTKLKRLKLVGILQVTRKVKSSN